MTRCLRALLRGAALIGPGALRDVMDPLIHDFRNRKLLRN